ncbi:aspartic peptidase domain-containing protein [Phellopilus nigrolimitatus]|nr:aspartic peptidase domain-containing protein [Phellopilus nigrolimitatus]
MSPSLALLVLTSFGLLGSASALSVPFSKVSTSAQFTVASGTKDQDSNDTFRFQNLNNVSSSDIYVTTLTVAGKEFVVQLDTGSSDLWLDTAGTDLSSLKQTGIQSGLSYGDGTVASGPVYVGDVTFGNFTVSQAFISAPGTNATTNNDKGLLGVGPPLLSAIDEALAGSAFNGDTLLGNIFAAEPSLPEFTTFLLSRSFATGATDGGAYTVGEIDSNFTTISSSPRLPVVSKDRWIVLMDGIVVNGKNVTGDSAFTVNGQLSGQTLANLDTGTSLAQIPQNYADAIYGSVPGAQRFISEGIYSVPCDAKINVSFVFDGQEFAVHPIDTVQATTDDSGKVVCYSGFPFLDGTSRSEDFLLGDSFLRNVYSLFSYGSFLSGSASPYIQLLNVRSFLFLDIHFLRLFF